MDVHRYCSRRISWSIFHAVPMDPKAVCASIPQPRWAPSKRTIEDAWFCFYDTVHPIQQADIELQSIVDEESSDDIELELPEPIGPPSVQDYVESLSSPLLRDL